MKKKMTPMQVINSAGIISLLFGMVCGFNAEVMSSLFIMLVINVMMGAIIFGQGKSGGDQ